MDLTPGSVVAGRYRADYLVGTGGMGEVWAGEHLNVGVKVAMKTLLVAAAAHHEVVARFRREAFLLGRVRSDHCARVLDFVEDEQHGLVLVMEFVEGVSLAEILDERSLAPEEATLLAVDLTTALCDLHRANVVHRDLKPGNLIMQPLPEGRTRAVVVDFGISRLLPCAHETEEETITGITKANMALGTVEYMAPEQILNSRDVTPVSDIYAVGAILFRALTGGHAYGEKSDEHLARAKLVEEPPPLTLDRADRVAHGLQAVVRRAMRRRPSDRYRSAEEMLKDLVPVRDLVKLAELDLESTTADGGPIAAVVVEEGQPSPRRPVAAAPAASASSAPGRFGQSSVLVALGVAFAVGAAAAAVVVPRAAPFSPVSSAVPPTPPMDERESVAAPAPGEMLVEASPPVGEASPPAGEGGGEAAPRTIDLDEPPPGAAVAGASPAGGTAKNGVGVALSAAALSAAGGSPSLAGVAGATTASPASPDRWLPPMPAEEKTAGGAGDSDPFAADPSGIDDLPPFTEIAPGGGAP